MSVKYSVGKLEAKAQTFLDSTDCPHCLRSAGILQQSTINVIAGVIGSTNELYLYLEITGRCTAANCVQTSKHVLHLEGAGAL